jgi:hypothetical protein
MVEPTTSDQKIKELEEKLAKAEQTILLQTQLIQSYQVIVQLTGLPDPMLPEVKLPEVKIEVAPDVPEKAPKKVKKSKPVPEVVAEPVPVPKPELKPVKPKKVKKVKTEEQPDSRIQVLKEYWDDLDTRLSFDEIRDEIESFEPRNEVEQKFKDSYYARFINTYMDRRPNPNAKGTILIKKPETTDEQVARMTEHEKPRRKLKIIEDPPKDLEKEIYKPEPETVKGMDPEKPRRKLKIIEDPPKETLKISEATRREMREINNNLMDYEKALGNLDEFSKEARLLRLKFNLA